MSVYLITGGAGYIGSHTVVELLNLGDKVVVLDNLCNASEESLRRVTLLTGQPIDFIRGDIRDRQILRRIFTDHSIDAVVHFAGLKAVGESSEIPLDYYENNVGGTLTLCQEMAEAGVFNLVFSSSATVYGDPASVPISEDFPTSATNPYGRSKLMVEEILRDLCASDDRWSVALLRYFNPVGAHPSGLIGEDPRGIPNNLLPFVAQVAIGKRQRLSVFGNDYPTADGTGIRDYIHVVDLALGHVRALAKIAQGQGVRVYNLGTGRGYSVLEMVRAFEEASGKTVAFTIAPRRPGDIAQCWADPSLAQQELGWQAQKGLKQMMEDAWRWQKNNPHGYHTD